MAASPIPPRRLERLRSAPLTYAAVGASGTASAPAGYRTVHEERVLQRRDLDGAAEDLLTWRVHQRAGLRVAASAPRAVPGAVVDLRLGPGPLSVRIPCRVVSVVEEPDRRGFAYGTLPGHPESGEELFLLRRGADGRITFTITAFSRPATALARLGGPLGTVVQDAMTRRYLAAPDRLAGRPPS